MPPLPPILLLLLLLLTTAHTQPLLTQTTWSTTSLIYHGEKTPSAHTSPYDLTPLGAQQLLDAGAVLRARYIDPPANGSQLTTAAVINGLRADAIDNSLLAVWSTDEAYVSASALACMQGLYPPGIQLMSAEAMGADGRFTQFPLEGYQYPDLKTFSGLDFNSVW